MQEQEQERQRLLGEQKQQQQQALVQKKQAREAWLEVLGGNIFVIWLCLFLLVSGVGMLVGIIAGYWTPQAWIIAVVTSFLLAPLAYALGYRKVMTPLSTMLPSLLGIATTFAVTWYTSHLNYSDSEVSHFWSITRTLWIGRQFTFGIVMGVAIFATVVIVLLINEDL